MNLTATKLTNWVASYFTSPSHARALDEHLRKEMGLWELLSRTSPNTLDALYLKVSDVDLDSDGSHLLGDATSKGKTSLGVNSNTVPFVVLPIHWGHGVKLGDFGVIWTEAHTVNGKHFNEAFTAVIAGDFGPAVDDLNPDRHKIGEASLEAFRRLGHERVKDGAVVDNSLETMARIVFFVGSGDGTKKTAAEIDAKVKALLTPFFP